MSVMSVTSIISVMSFIRVIFLSVFCLSFNLDTSFCMQNMQKSSANPTSSNSQNIQNSEAKKNSTTKMGGAQVTNIQKCDEDENKDFLKYFRFNFTSIVNRVLTIGSMVLCIVLSTNVISNGQSNSQNEDSVAGLKDGISKIDKSQSDIEFDQDKIECLITTKKNLSICDTVAAMNRRMMSSMNIEKLNGSQDLHGSEIYSEMYNAELFDGLSDASNSDSTSIALSFFICSLIIVFSIFTVRCITKVYK